MQATHNVTARGAASNGNVRLYYRAREVAALTGLGLRTIYQGVYAGWIPSRKIGNSRLIPASWLAAATDHEADAIAQNEATSQDTSILWAIARAAARAIASAATRVFCICCKPLPLCYVRC